MKEQKRPTKEHRKPNKIDTHEVSTVGKRDLLISKRHLLTSKRDLT